MIFILYVVIFIYSFIFQFSTRTRTKAWSKRSTKRHIRPATLTMTAILYISTAARRISANRWLSRWRWSKSTRTTSSPTPTTVFSVKPVWRSRSLSKEASVYLQVSISRRLRHIENLPAPMILLRRRLTSPVDLQLWIILAAHRVTVSLPMSSSSCCLCCYSVYNRLGHYCHFLFNQGHFRNWVC